MTTNSNFKNLPHYFNSEMSPIMKDSAFPPFKIQHRYRGVYERAGFDVNLDGIRSTRSDSRSTLEHKLHTPTKEAFDLKAFSPSNMSYNSSGSNNRSMQKESLRSDEESVNKKFVHSSENASSPARQLPFKYESKESFVFPTDTYVKEDKSFSMTLPNDSTTSDTASYIKRSENEVSNQRYDMSTGYSSLQDNGTNFSDHQASDTSSQSYKSFQQNRSELLDDGYANDFEVVNSSHHGEDNHQVHAKSYSYQTSADFDFQQHDPGQDHAYADRAYNGTEDTLISQETSAPQSEGPFDPRKMSTRNRKNLKLSLDNVDETDANFSISVDPQIAPIQNYNGNLSQNTLYEEEASGAKQSEHGEPFIDDPIPHARNGKLDYTDAVIPTPPVTGSSDSFNNKVYAFPHQRLSAAFLEFEKDIGDHKNYTPKTPKTDSDNGFSPNLEIPTVVVSGENAPYPTQDHHLIGVIDEKVQQDQLDGSNHQNFGTHSRNYSQQSDVSLENEYQRMLSSERHDTDRLSKASMVSSIISKDSMYQEEEISKELQRQLDNLKVTDMDEESKDIPTLAENVYHSDDEFEETTSLQPRSASGSDSSNIANEFVDVAPIPVHDIESFRDISQHEREFISPFKEQKVDESDKLTSPAQPNTRSSYGSVRSLVIAHREHSNGNILSDQSNSNSFDFSTNNIASSMSDISNKNHEQYEAEQYNMSYKEGIKHSNEEPVYGVGHEEFSNTQEDFQSMPTICLPGEGPCRTCNKEIPSNPTGNMKPVYSRTGELSGQWHRGCFSCSFDSCSVKFAKNIQCYALDDNPYCYQHYHLLNNTMCETCGKGIEGECVENELQQKWHMNCLKCNYCSRNINTDYYVINDTIYCEKDAESITKGRIYYNDNDGNLKIGNLSSKDRIEKRRTRIMNAE